MTHTLVTILGKARQRDGELGYKEATYRFPDGREDRSAFFGLALARHLAPDEIVILGTTSSMWSVLVEDLAHESDEEDARITLMEAESEGSVNQPLLNRLRPLMEQAMKAVVRPTLIPTASDEREQFAILNAVDGAVARNSDLDFDLTHGFRHLGMVGFLSSFMLERLRGLGVRGLWYGALDMTEGGVTPVLRLDGLVRVRRWLDALDRFDHTGDYGVFASLLKQDGVPQDKVRSLEAAAFLERTLNVRDAARQIETFLPVLAQPLHGASGLFQSRLATRLRWAEAETLSEQQRRLAQQYLIRGDFVRAAIFGKEACVSREYEKHDMSKLRVREGRERAEAELENELKRTHGRRASAYWTLENIRNALAHGTRPRSRDLVDALKNPQRLHEELQRALDRFFGDDEHTPTPAYHMELQKMLKSFREVPSETLAGEGKL